MEPASRLQEMSFPEKLRPKQREIIEAFATADEVIAKLPTGYGKTLAAAGAYAMLRHRAACNRMLYVVPRTTQATQAAESVPMELAMFGIKSLAIEVSRDPMQALRRHRDGTVEVFVTTVQALHSSPATKRTLSDLMQTGRWFLVIDEHHHYGEDTAWADALKALPSRAILAMSATPNRHDGSDHFPDPGVSESYLSAAKAGYLKTLRLHAYDYVVDAVTVDGKSIPFTTEQIVEEAGSDSPESIDRFVAARKMRWSPKYISPLVTFPLDRIVDLRTRNVRAQMLVQAMSCTHASMVCEQIRALLPENMTVDWVGTGPSGRSDKENRAAIEAFCPKKDEVTGRRHWTLDVLVNVGIASEGLDSTDVAEVVFLTPANITITNLQTIGRGARLIPQLQVQPACHVNVDTGSPMAEFVGPRVMGLFDDQSQEEEESKEDAEALSRESDYEPLPETMSVVIVDVRLSDIRKGSLWEEALRLGIATASPATPREQIEAAVESGLMKFMNRTANVSSSLAQKREQVNHAVSKVAGLMLRRIAESGVRVERTLSGDLRRRINSQKKRMFACSVEDADEQQLDAQWTWLRNLEKDILIAHALTGVPTWLR